MNFFSIGTRSVLFGVHQFLLHPIFIALGWFRAYGFKRVRIGNYVQHHYLEGHSESIVVHRACFASLFTWQLWLASFVHDIGYLGKPNMDGPEGETHPEVGARIMRFFAGAPWDDFVLLHSRYYAKKLGRPVSALCIADKWVFVIEPRWLYLPRVLLSGEVHEFIAQARQRVLQNDENYTEAEKAGYLAGTPTSWHAATKSFMRRWLAAHSQGEQDTRTPTRHKAAA